MKLKKKTLFSTIVFKILNHFSVYIALIKNYSLPFFLLSHFHMDTLHNMGLKKKIIYFLLFYFNSHTFYVKN